MDSVQHGNQHSETEEKNASSLWYDSCADQESPDEETPSPMRSTSDVLSPLKKQRLDFINSVVVTEDQIHRNCSKSNRRYYLYAEKSNGIRVGVGDLVSVQVRDASETRLCFCQVASIWKVSSDEGGDSNDFIIAGRWLERPQKLTEYLHKSRCRYVIFNIMRVDPVSAHVIYMQRITTCSSYCSV